MRKAFFFTACLALLVLLAACMPPGIVKSRLDVIDSPASCATRATTLVVLLPGAYDTPQDLVEQGFVSAVRRRKLNADIMVVDTHFGYYRANLIVKRLHEDIILPARQKGYRQIWLAGISLGGYGALHYASQHGDSVTGIFLMAPYLGKADLLREIAAAGGPARWQPGAVGADEHDRALWAWLTGHGQPGMQDLKAAPRIYIGYGMEDRFAESSRMLAALISPAQAATTDGGHDWASWLRLWDGFLEKGMLPRCA